MANRCSVYFNWFDGSSEAKIIELFGEPNEEFDDEQGDRQLVYHEMNYAGTEDLDALAKEDPRFCVVGMHTEGEDYEACAFVYIDGRGYEWPLSMEREYVIVNKYEDAVDFEGIAEQTDELRVFIELRAAAIEKIKEASDAEAEQGKD